MFSKDSEEEYRTFVDHLQGIAFKGNMDFTPVFFHGLVKEITGYSEEEFVHSKPRWDQIIHPIDLPGLRESFERIRSIAGFSDQREYRIVRKDGKIRWVHEFISNVCDESGKPVWVQGMIYDITGRKEMGEALEREKKRLDTVTTFANCGLLLLDSETHITYANKLFQNWFGSVKNYIGKKCYEILKLNDPDHECAGLQTIKNKKAVIKENHVVLDNGEEKWFSVSTFPLMNSDGDVDQITAVLTDITDHKKYEEQIERQNDFFNIILESLSHPFYIIDVHDYTIKMANTNSGFGPNYKGLTCYALTHNESKPCSGDHPCPLETIKKTGKPVIVEHIHKNTDGDPRYYEIHGYPIFDEEGKLTQIIEYNQDITERREAEQALKNSEEKYHRLFSSLQEGIWAIDQHEVTIFVNKPMAEMLGYSVDEMIGKKVFDFMDERGRKLCEYYVERRRENVIEQHDFELITKEGERIYVTMEASPTFDDDGNYIGGVTGVINITERKKAEDELKKAKDEIETWNRELEKRVKEKSEELVQSQKQLLEAEKLSAMGQMAGGLAHELNSPLSGLLPMIEKFRDDAEEGTRSHEELSVMLKACHHMARVIRDFGAFSRKSEGIFSPVSLNNTIEDTLSFSTSQFKNKGIRLIKEFSKDLPEINGIHTELQQVILNIISNACDATPAGGTLTIRTGCSDDRRNVIMEFTDTGAGIAKKNIHNIFDPFFTTKKTGEGTGLGLAVSYGIIKKHNGHISVSSESGKGSTFHITIPSVLADKTGNKRSVHTKE